MFIFLPFCGFSDFFFHFPLTQQLCVYVLGRTCMDIYLNTKLADSFVFYCENEESSVWFGWVGMIGGSMKSINLLCVDVVCCSCSMLLLFLFCLLIPINCVSMAKIGSI